MVSAETTPEVTDLSALDWDVACDYDTHDRVGNGPAVWIVLFAQTCPCSPSGWRPFCSACFRWRTEDFVCCPTCFDVIPGNSDVLRVERLRPPP